MNIHLVADERALVQTPLEGARSNRSTVLDSDEDEGWMIRIGWGVLEGGEGERIRCPIDLTCGVTAPLRGR